MACERKQQLASEYEKAVQKFAASVSELQRKMGTSPKTEYRRLLRTSDEARVKSESARLALEEHTSTHEC